MSKQCLLRMEPAVINLYVELLAVKCYNIQNNNNHNHNHKHNHNHNNFIHLGKRQVSQSTKIDRLILIGYQHTRMLLLQNVIVLVLQ